MISGRAEEERRIYTPTTDNAPKIFILKSIIKKECPLTIKHPYGTTFFIFGKEY
jgi:hypothetical protein